MDGDVHVVTAVTTSCSGIGEEVGSANLSHMVTAKIRERRLSLSIQDDLGEERLQFLYAEFGIRERRYDLLETFSTNTHIL